MYKRLAFLFLFLLPLFMTMSAQKLVNSPYGRFNIGNLNRQGSFRTLAMGGTGVAMRDNSTVMFFNPASYSSIDTSSFLFDFGLDYGTAVLKAGTDKHSSGDANFHHLLIGFPVKRGIGIATGLVPVSNGYYYMSKAVAEGDADYDPVIGAYASVHRGNGTLTKYFLGTGINLFKGLSAGANMSVLFGQLEKLNQYEFLDFSNSFNQRSSESLRISGINFDLGLQYSGEISKNWFITAGGSYSTGQNYRSSLVKLEERFTIYPVGAYSPDTLNYLNTSGKDSTRLPSTLRFGLSAGKRDKFTVSVDYTITAWSDARIHGSDLPMADTKELSAGLEFTPEKYSLTSFLKRIDYRAGLHYGNSYFILNGAELKEFGVSAGLGIRLRGSMSKTNLFFDYTKREAESTAGLHSEGIYTVGISLNIFDYWFLKRKYE